MGHTETCRSSSPPGTVPPVTDRRQIGAHRQQLVLFGGLLQGNGWQTWHAMQGLTNMAMTCKQQHKTKQTQTQTQTNNYHKHKHNHKHKTQHTQTNNTTTHQTHTQNNNITTTTTNTTEQAHIPHTHT